MPNQLVSVEIYNNWVKNLKQSEAKKDSWMQEAVGGEFEACGLIEEDLLIQHGLQNSDYIIDVGCGSGRLAIPLSDYLRGGKYLGTDVNEDLLSYARGRVQNKDFRFELVNGFNIPEKDNEANMVCFFSVFTHVLYEESYNYLVEAKRVLKPGGLIIFSFLEFFIPGHWYAFEYCYKNLTLDKSLLIYLSREAITTWANHLNLSVEGIYDGDKPHIKLSRPVTFRDGRVMSDFGYLGQSVCVLRK